MICFLLFCNCNSFVLIVKFDVFVFRINILLEFGSVNIGVEVRVLIKWLIVFCCLFFYVNGCLFDNLFKGFVILV